MKHEKSDLRVAFFVSTLETPGFTQIYTNLTDSSPTNGSCACLLCCTIGTFSTYPEFAMTRSSVFGALGLALVLAGVAGCSSKKTAVYEHENFDDSGTFSRSFPVSDAGSCEAARRALLSQGYIITNSGANQVVGNKSFQQNSENHLQISFNVTCAPDVSDEQRSTMFANALQDRYALKRSNTSASLGVGVLGSVSMPIGSSDDSMVKVASETVTAAQFYDRYFAPRRELPAQAQAEEGRRGQGRGAQGTETRGGTGAAGAGSCEPGGTCPGAGSRTCGASCTSGCGRCPGQ